MNTFKNIILYIFKELVLLVIGGLIYNGIEIGVRGYTHWSMFIVGGLCFVIIGLINEIFTWETSIVTQSLIGGLIITVLEFISGIILNIKLGWNIWDYSEKPFNLLGQICLENCFWWIFLACIAIVLDDYIRYYIFKEEKPHYTL